jgi:parvulin-like peptidyl-prolyl isomerase
MQKGLALLVAAFVLGNPAAYGAERQADPPLVVNGDLSLTTLDFEAYMRRVPEHLRDDFKAGLERIKTTVDGLWMQRMLASKAREAGLDKDPLVISRGKQAQEAVLADIYLEHVLKNIAFPNNLEARALEIYKAHPDQHTLPERVHVQHILTSFTGRTADRALERTKEIHAQVVSGKEDFLSYAQQFSEDSALRTNGGDLGFVPLKSFAEPMAKAIEKMKKAGEISEPVRSVYGYHIIRFVDRKPARLQPFDEVKAGLIQAEKEKIIDEKKRDTLDSARADPNNHLFLENVEALQVQPKVTDAATQQPKMTESPKR